MAGVLAVDALNCQKDFAQTMIDGGGDYGLALKANHPPLHQAVVDWLAWAQARDLRDGDNTFYEPMTKGHGRVESRQGDALTDSHPFQALAYSDGWAGLPSIAVVYRQPRLAHPTPAETAYFLSSLPADAQPILVVTRAHWLKTPATARWT